MNARWGPDTLAQNSIQPSILEFLSQPYLSMLLSKLQIAVPVRRPLFALMLSLVPPLFIASFAACAVGAQATPPNVLFIAIDDLNDWIGCLGGHPQCKTPNIDRLAARGTLFANAHCQAPICNPSRASLLTGKLPSSSGIYYLSPGIREYSETRQLITIPQHFARNGYYTWGAGKIFHQGDASEFEKYAGTFGGFGPRPGKPISAGHTHPLWDWGEFPDEDAAMPDAKIADAVSQELSNVGGQPFFLAVGFYRPHVPLYVPQQWYERFPLDEIQLPVHRDNDLQDIPAYGQDLSWSSSAPRHQWMVDHRQWKKAVQAYLASIAFVDAQVGKVLAALDDSPFADNTIVVLWSDHGFHLGTKERWGKRSLWEDSTRVVLMASGPGISPRQVCEKPVGLIDLYPTLIDLCNLTDREGLEGRSLSPLLSDSEAHWPWPTLTTFGQHNHAIRTDQWRYVCYADGSEELYDHRVDPEEFRNLAGESEYLEVIAELRDSLPDTNVPMAPGSAHADARPGSPADIDGRRNP